MNTLADYCGDCSGFYDWSLLCTNKNNDGVNVNMYILIITSAINTFRVKKMN